jgi:hypothetical protein
MGTTFHLGNTNPGDFMNTIKKLSLILFLSAFFLNGCSSRDDGKKSTARKDAAPPIVSPDQPPATDPGNPAPEPPTTPTLPVLAASNHPLGGWWIGSGDISNTTGWHSKCDSIALGLVVNVPAESSENATSVESTAVPAEVVFEHFKYACQHGPFEWGGRVVFKVGENGILSHNNKPVGVLSASSFRFELTAENGLEYSFELNFADDELEFLDFYKQSSTNLITITTGRLKRKVNAQP